MQRVLISLFALHFFVSVGLFSFASSAFSASKSTLHATLCCEAVERVSSDHPQDQSDIVPIHGLVDHQPDLPDDLEKPAVSLQASGQPYPLCVDRHRGIVQPHLDSIQRPPQA